MSNVLHTAGVNGNKFFPCFGAFCACKSLTAFFLFALVVWTITGRISHLVFYCLKQHEKSKLILGCPFNLADYYYQLSISHTHTNTPPCVRVCYQLTHTSCARAADQRERERGREQIQFQFSLQNPGGKDFSLPVFNSVTKLNTSHRLFSVSYLSVCVCVCVFTSITSFRLVLLSLCQQCHSLLAMTTNTNSTCHVPKLERVYVTFFMSILQCYDIQVKTYVQTT